MLATIFASCLILAFDESAARISAARTEPGGITVHEVDSPYQSGRTLIRVLMPEAATKTERDLPVIYVLPVEAGEESRYGDGLRTIQAAGLHKTYPAVYVAPTFSQLPWYADHPTDPTIRQESHLLKVVLPFVKTTYSKADPLLIGFSKSGFGAWSLFLRNKGTFRRAVAWDAPLMMDRPGPYSSGPIFGTKESFERYEVARLLREGRGNPGLIHLGHSNFGRDHRQAELLLKDVPHRYRPGPRRPHTWESGWLGEAIELLLGPEVEPKRAAIVLKGEAMGGPVEVTFTPRVAFSVHSLKWKGKEFVDSFDHGRQIQSASNLDLGMLFHPETFNPTEAGSRDDGADEPTRSRVLDLEHGPDWLRSKTAMAFWLQPGEESGGFPAINRTILSDHILEKRVQLGLPGMSNVLRFDVRFLLPQAEAHRYAQFEALTGYMPEEFAAFWTFDPKSGRLDPLGDGPGEQNRPVVLATKDGAFAMGVYSPDQPSRGFEGAGYGRFRFTDAKVTKWNAVFRVRDPKPGASYDYRIFVPFGSLDDVRRALQTLTGKSTSLRS